MAWPGTISFLTLHKTICCSVMTVLFLQWQDLQYLCIGALYVVVTNQWRMEQKMAMNNITAKHCMMVYEVEHSNVMMQQWIVWWCNSTSYEGATKHCSLCNRALWDGATENWMMMQHCIVWWHNNALYAWLCKTDHCIIMQQGIVWWGNRDLYDGATEHCNKVQQCIL